MAKKPRCFKCTVGEPLSLQLFTHPQCHMLHMYTHIQTLLSHAYTHTLTHTLSHTHTLTYSQPHPHTPPHTHTFTRTHLHTHTHTHAHPVSTNVTHMGSYSMRLEFNLSPQQIHRVHNTRYAKFRSV